MTEKDWKTDGPFGRVLTRCGMTLDDFRRSCAELDGYLKLSTQAKNIIFGNDGTELRRLLHERVRENDHYCIGRGLVDDDLLLLSDRQHRQNGGVWWFRRNGPQRLRNGLKCPQVLYHVGLALPGTDLLIHYTDNLHGEAAGSRRRVLISRLSTYRQKAKNAGIGRQLLRSTVPSTMRADVLRRGLSMAIMPVEWVPRYSLIGKNCEHMSQAIMYGQDGSVQSGIFWYLFSLAVIVAIMVPILTGELKPMKFLLAFLAGIAVAVSLYSFWYFSGGSLFMPTSPSSVSQGGTEDSGSAVQ